MRETDDIDETSETRDESRGAQGNEGNEGNEGSDAESHDALDEALDVEAEDASPPPEYTIDELAAQTGIPSRTIRFYQSSGALQKPSRRGRVAVYGPEHVERLALIGQLQDRGLRMRAIAALVERIDRGEVAFDEWLGLEGELQSSWSDEEPQLLGRGELEERVGERRPGFLAELVRHGLAEPQENGAHLVRSPTLLRIALELEDAGVSLSLSSGATHKLQKHLERAARDLADHVVKEIEADESGEGSVQQLTNALQRLRPAAREWVQLLFSREMERELRERLEKGDPTPKKKKRRRARR